MTDRADPQGVHRDGLNLSRAWCLRRLAAVVGPDDPRAQVLAAAARAHLDAAVPLPLRTGVVSLVAPLVISTGVPL